MTTIKPKKAPLVIHVNSHNIRANRKHGSDKPVITVRRGRGSVVEYCNELEITGASRLVYGDPLGCGAEVWLETDSEVKCITEGR
jgi:hypothetical protein